VIVPPYSGVPNVSHQLAGVSLVGWAEVVLAAVAALVVAFDVVVLAVSVGLFAVSEQPDNIRDAINKKITVTGRSFHFIVYPPILFLCGFTVISALKYYINTSIKRDYYISIEIDLIDENAS